MAYEHIETKLQNASLVSLKERELLQAALDKAKACEHSTDNDFALKVYEAFTYDIRTFFKIPPQFFDVEDWVSSEALSIFIAILDLR